MICKEHRVRIAGAQAVYLAIATMGAAPEVYEASAAVKAAKVALTDALVEGAAPCPRCGSKPHGMLQPQEMSAGAASTVVASVPGAEACEGGVLMVEIGCLACKHHRARGLTRELALRAWHDGLAVYDGVDVSAEDKITKLPPSWYMPTRYKP